MAERQPKQIDLGDFLPHHFLGTCVPQTIMGCLEGEGQSAFQRILDKVRSESLDVQTVVSLLRLYQDSNPAVKTALSDRKPEAVEAVQPKGRRNPTHLSDCILFWEDATKLARVIPFFSGLLLSDLHINFYL